MSKGFKKFPHDWRKRVFKELKGIRLSVWMYHWSRSGPDDLVETTLDQLVEDLPYCKSEMVKARGELRKAGWLEVDKASYQDERGRWTVPTFKPVIPEATTIFPKSTPKAGKPLAGNPVAVPLPENPLTDRSGKTANGKPATTVDTEFSIDTGAETLRVTEVNTSTPSPLSPLNISISTELAEILGIHDSREIEVDDPDKAKAFARWMIGTHPLKKDGSPRIVSLRDFLHHWNNESGSDNGFRLQWEAIQGITRKSKEVPRSDWDWICRAPACSRPWTEELHGFKLCARCAAAFPDHPAENEVKWVHQCMAYYPGTEGKRRCYQPAIEQFADWWVCPEHIEDVRSFYGDRRPYPEDIDIVPALIFAEPEEASDTIGTQPLIELTTADEL